MENYIDEFNIYFELKNAPESTRESYLRRIKAFIKFVTANGKSMEDIDVQDIRAYILYLKEMGLSPGTINNYISAVRFFHTNIMDREWNSNKIPRMKNPKKLPVIPEREAIVAILNGTDNLKHRAILFLLYGSGLRVSEVAKLRIGDICGKSMRVRVEDAKHGTNRYAILSEKNLIALREYFKAYWLGKPYHPDDWLFPGRKQGEHLNVKSIKNTMIKLRNKLGIDDRISAHTLRRCYATHSLENGVDIATISHLLGHKHIRTTFTYLFLTSKAFMGIKSPLDNLGEA